MATTVITENFNGNFTIATGENYYLAEGVTHSQTSTSNMLVTTGTGVNNIYIAGTMVQLGNAEAVNAPSTTGNGISVRSRALAAFWAAVTRVASS